MWVMPAWDTNKYLVNRSEVVDEAIQCEHDRWWGGEGVQYRKKGLGTTGAMPVGGRAGWAVVRQVGRKINPPSVG